VVTTTLVKAAAQPSLPEVMYSADFLQCKTTQVAHFGRAYRAPSCPFSGVFLPRRPNVGEAVFDPERHFVTVNYCIAKGLFDHPVRWRARPSRRFEASSISISQRPSQPN